MSGLTKLISIGVLILLAGGAIFLWTVDIPAPSEKTTKTISNDRFKK